MKKTFSVVIAEDLTIVREGLHSILSSHPDLKVVCEAKDGIEAIRCVQDHTADVILLDLSMQRMTGLDAVKVIKGVSPRTKIVVLTAHKPKQYILSTLSAGVHGYVLKEDHSAELLRAIRHVLDGHQYISSSIPGTIRDRLLDGGKTSAIRPSWETLTLRERQVLKLIVKGDSNEEIADFLRISDKTVEKHRVNLMKKLDLHDVAVLTALAARGD